MQKIIIALRKAAHVSASSPSLPYNFKNLHAIQFGRPSSFSKQTVLKLINNCS